MTAPLQSKDIYGNVYDITVADLSWRPAAYGIVTHRATHGDQVLLVKANNLFHMPGGGIDLGEHPEAAVIREVHEETGMRVTNPRLVGSLSNFFAHAHRHTTGELRHVQALLLYYVCDPANDNRLLTTDNLMADERAYGLTPEWVDIAKVPTLPLGTTVDWRPIVTRALQRG